MRVGVHLVGSQELIEGVKDDLSIEQAMNVATLPGVIDPVLTMPDMHQGYGFPIGGVAAFRLEDGIISPGGVGYDIANLAFTNRQLITYWVRRVFENHFGPIETELLYDVCHNIAKFEEMVVEGKPMTVCIHRKGATRAYPPHHPKVPEKYQEVGQPILIPGDMGRYSFVLAGRPESMELSFGSACHGAGRALSRTKAKQKAAGRKILRELEDEGIYVKAAGYRTVMEEIPEAYKDATRVVEAIHEARIANIVARLRPIGVVKG